MENPIRNWDQLDFYTSCKRAQAAWAYIELTHRNMLQEKKEIETNPEQERIELAVLYVNCRTH